MRGKGWKGRVGFFLLWRCAAHLAGEEVRSGEEGAEALHNHHSATTVDGRDLSLHNLVIRIHLRHAIPRLAEEDAPPREHLLTVLVLVESKGEERQGAVSALSVRSAAANKKAQQTDECVGGARTLTSRETTTNSYSAPTSRQFSGLSGLTSAISCSCADEGESRAAAHSTQHAEVSRVNGARKGQRGKGAGGGLAHRAVGGRLDADVDERAVRLEADHGARRRLSPREFCDLAHTRRHVLIREAGGRDVIISPAALRHVGEAAVARAHPLVAAEFARHRDREVNLLGGRLAGGSSVADRAQRRGSSSSMVSGAAEMREGVAHGG